MDENNVHLEMRNLKQTELRIEERMAEDKIEHKKTENHKKQHLAIETR